MGQGRLNADPDVYLNEPWMHISWDRAHNCVLSQWKGFATSAQFRLAGMTGLQAVREKHATGYVSDSRLIKVILHEDQMWTSETLFPMMGAAGLKRIGVVTAEAGLGKAMVDEIAVMAGDRSIRMRTFDSVVAAMQWVKDA